MLTEELNLVLTTAAGIINDSRRSKVRFQRLHNWVMCGKR